MGKRFIAFEERKMIAVLYFFIFSCSPTISISTESYLHYFRVGHFEWCRKKGIASFYTFKTYFSLSLALCILQKLNKIAYVGISGLRNEEKKT
jgi:hypothetical protein